MSRCRTGADPGIRQQQEDVCAKSYQIYAREHCRTAQERILEAYTVLLLVIFPLYNTDHYFSILSDRARFFRTAAWLMAAALLAEGALHRLKHAGNASRNRWAGGIRERIRQIPSSMRFWQHSFWPAPYPRSCPITGQRRGAGMPEGSRDSYCGWLMEPLFSAFPVSTAPESGIYGSYWHLPP